MTKGVEAQVENKLAAFLAAGYDPLTVPNDWYLTERVTGAPELLPLLATGVNLHSDALIESIAWADAQATTALLVSQNRQILLERYAPGDGRDTRANSMSMTKTVVAILVGIAIDRGEIGSFHSRVADWLTEWQGDARGTMTIGHLLQMASGLGQVDAGFGFQLTPENPAIRQFFGDDLLGPALTLPLVAPPGTCFDYNNSGVLLLAAILERASKKRFSELLSERLWQPLGLGDASVGIDRLGGFAMASGSLFARPADWLRIGELLAGLRPGIVSAAWLAAMQVPSPTNPAYGYLCWLGDHLIGSEPLPPVLTPWQSEAFASRSMVMLNGFGGQRVWVMADKHLVVVRTGRTWPSAWDDAKLPNLFWHGVTR